MLFLTVLLYLPSVLISMSDRNLSINRFFVVKYSVMCTSNLQSAGFVMEKSQIVTDSTSNFINAYFLKISLNFEVN